MGVGCGAPINHTQLKEGETVVDLGSGAGIDIFLAVRKVLDSGRAIGIDMTGDMLQKARENAKKVVIQMWNLRKVISKKIFH